MGMKRKLNQKSLYQEGGAMSSTNSANNAGSLAQDIQSQMELGVSPSIIYRDMLVSYLPADEINAAFQELGYSQDDVSDLYEQVVEMMNEEQQSSEPTMQEAQFGGWVNAPDYYLPMDLGKKGDPLNAALFAGKAVMDLFGGKDRDGDGFKDGAWRDLGKKRKAFKNFKNQKLQSFIPDTTSDTIDDEVGPNVNSDGYDPELEVENYLKQAREKEKNRLYFNEPDFPVTSSTTSVTTPKPTTTPTTTPKQTPVDYSYLDPAISQMLDFESKSGGYDPSMGAYGLTNLGANRYMMGPNSLNINSPTYRADLTERIKQDYAPSLAGFAQEAQPAMLDYAYNTGRDPRIYMLDAYLKEQGQPGLSNRGAYKDAMQDYTWTDKNLEQQFNTEYGKYKDAIGNLSGQDQLRLMNEGRKFYYNNINQVNGQPNPAAQATWLQRPFYKSGGQLPKAQFGIPTTADSLALYNNAILKGKFYENNPDYRDGTPNTDNSDIAYIFDEIVNNADMYNNSASDFYANTANRSSSNNIYGSPEERFKVINPNMVQLGDILSGLPNSWYNNSAPPILLHNIIEPKRWMRYNSLDDRTDIPYYDPVEIYPKSLGEVPKEAYRYSDIRGRHPLPYVKSAPSASTSKSVKSAPSASVTPSVNYNTDLVAYLQKEGKPFDYNTRKDLAKQYGIDNYKGTAAQNIELLNLIKKGPSPVREKEKLGTLPVKEANSKEILNPFEKEGTYSRSRQPQESGSTMYDELGKQYQLIDYYTKDGKKIGTYDPVKYEIVEKYQSGGSLPKYQMQGEVLPEVTVTPFDNVMPNMPQTFDTIAPDFSGFEDINKNNIPDYLERNDPAKNQMGTQGVQGGTKTTSVQGPQLPPDPFDNVIPDMSNTFDNVQGDVSTDTTGEDLPMYNKNPFVEAFGKTFNTAVSGADLLNEIFASRDAEKAKQDFINSTMADKIYGAYNERPGSRGMWDVNTGLAQPDNLDVGYAQMGMEMSPKLNMLRMFTGGGMVYNDMYMPQYQVGGEAKVDNQTLAALIAAGADIEIL